MDANFRTDHVLDAILFDRLAYVAMGVAASAVVATIATTIVVFATATWIAGLVTFGIGLVALTSALALAGWLSCKASQKHQVAIYDQDEECECEVCLDLRSATGPPTQVLPWGPR